jgi:hypothetical protein
MDYQQWLICSGSKITTDGSYEPLQMTFSIVVQPSTHMQSHTSAPRPTPESL